MDNKNPPTTTNGPGYPTKITDNCVNLLIGAFQNGLTVKKACIYAGISRTAFYERCKVDQQFLDTMQKAQNNLLELAGDRISTIIRVGADRDAGPLAWKVFQSGMPDKYGAKAPIVDNSKKTQNNFLVLNHEQISNIGQQPDIKSADPTELLEALEEASRLELREEEDGAPPVHPTEIPHNYSDDSDLQ